MYISCKKQNEIGIVKLLDGLTAATVETFRIEFTGWQAAEEDVKNYVVDLSQVDFMDSAGLGTLVAMLKRVRERGGEMKIYGLQPKPRMVFEITRAYKVFDICNTVDEAIEKFSE